MTDEELIARLNRWIEQQVLMLVDSDLLPIRDRIEAQAAEIERLRLLVPRPDQTQDELVWRDHMRGVPLAALAKEFGVTKERMRYL
jgi:hypothetical protein